MDENTSTIAATEDGDNVLKVQPDEAAESSELHSEAPFGNAETFTL